MTTRSDGGPVYPYPALNFLVEVEGSVEAGFSSCHVGGSSTRVLTYREGVDDDGPRVLPGGTSYEPVTLERGVTDSPTLADWRRLVEEGEIAEARRPVTIVLLDEGRDPGARWELTAAWPSRYVGPRLDALDGDVAVERLELTHEGVERVAE